MLTTEQQTQIVNLMYPDGDEPSFTFSYSSEELVFKIFKELVDECKKGGLNLSFKSQSVYKFKIIDPVNKSEICFLDLNNESICLAFLSVMESK